MSAINVLVQRDAVHMMTDGLSYIDGVPFEVNLNKAHLLRGMRAALSATGPALLGEFIAEHVEREFSSFDELVSRGSVRIKGLFRQYVDTCRNGDAVSSLMLVGWHEEENRPAAYGIDMETAGSKADWVNANNPHEGLGVASELTELRVGFMPSPTAEIMIAAGYDFLGDLDAKDAAKDLLQVLEIQRRMTIDGVSYVGGIATLTTVTADGVAQRVVHRWHEDRPGKKIVPASIDWSARRAARGKPSGAKRQMPARRAPRRVAVAQQNAELPTRVVAAVRDARTRRMLG